MLRKPRRVGGSLLEIEVLYSDPALTAELANGFVNALSYYWNNLNYTEARKKREYIESQLPRVESELKKAESNFKKFTLLSPQGVTASLPMPGKITASQSQGIEISRLSRELEIQSSVYTMLRKEFESVRLEESKEIPPFSIIDQAYVPEKPIKPRKKMSAVVGFMLGSFSGVFLAFFREYWTRKEA
jgi:uncharacterized protein involved in exopolysaccharide biosynthesis